MSISILIHDSTIKITMNKKEAFGSEPNKQCIISHPRSHFNQMIPTIQYGIPYLGEKFKNLNT